MKRRSVLLALSLSLLCAAAFALTAIQTVTPPTETPTVTISLTPLRYSVVIKADIYVRAGPGELYTPIGQLVEGDPVRGINRNTAGDWVLIPYRRGFGWIRRDLAIWIEDIDHLPVLDVPNLTPTFPPGKETATPFFPTSTPPINYVRVFANSAYVRAGPGRTYLRVSQLYLGEAVEPVARNADGSWIMIRIDGGFGWIERDLVVWAVDLDPLPVVSEDNLTPSLTFTPSDTPTLTYTPTATDTATLTFTPTSTPTDTATLTPTQTPTATYTPSDTPTATATATVSPTDTPSVTPTETATVTLVPTTPAPSDTVAPSATTAAIVSTDTPTATPSETASATATHTSTVVPTHTPSATSTSAPTIDVAASLTQSAVSFRATQTAAAPGTATAVAAAVVPTYRPTEAPTETAQVTATLTLSPTVVPSQTATQPRATFTQVPTIDVAASLTQSAVDVHATQTAAAPRTATAVTVVVPTKTPPAPTLTPRSAAASATPTATATLLPTVDVAASLTQSATEFFASQVAAALGSATPTSTFTAIPTVSPAATSTSPAAPNSVETLAAMALSATVVPTQSISLLPTSVEGGTPNIPLTPTAVPSQPAAGGGISSEAVVGLVGILVVLGYAGLYWRGMVSMERYARGFPVERCPVCHRGTLTVETKPDRVIGIPRARRTVRCNQCRSMLRETGIRRWRYAVDRLENPALYEQYNGREVDEATLEALASQPIPPNGAGSELRPRPPVTPPSFVDDDEK